MNISQWLAKPPVVGAIGLETWCTIGGHKLRLEAVATIDRSAPAGWRGWKPVDTAMETLADRVSFAGVRRDRLRALLNEGIDGEPYDVDGEAVGIVYRRQGEGVLVIKARDVRVRLTASRRGDLDVGPATDAVMEFVARLWDCPTGRELVKSGLRTRKALLGERNRVPCREPLQFVEVKFRKPNDDLVDVEGLLVRRLVRDKMLELFGPHWWIEAGALRRTLRRFPAAAPGRILNDRPEKDGPLCIALRTSDRTVEAAAEVGAECVTAYTVLIRDVAIADSTRVVVDDIWKGAS